MKLQWSLSRKFHYATRGLIWKSKIHDRLKMHLWRVAANWLPTKTTLARFTNNGDIICLLYKADEETCLHLFVYCLCAWSVWFSCQWGLKSENLGINSPSNSLGHSLTLHWANINGDQRDDLLLFGNIISNICDNIWKARNLVIFEGVAPNPYKLWQKIARSVAEFKSFINSQSGP